MTNPFTSLQSAFAAAFGALTVATLFLTAAVGPAVQVI